MKRVVITGIGWVTPLGYDINAVWDRLLNGDCAIGPTRKFDASTFPTTFSSEVPESFDYRGYIKKPELHEGVGLNTAFALGAAVQAWRNAGLDRPDENNPLDPERVGLYLGSGEGSLDFDHYVSTNLESWDPDQRGVDTNK